MRRRQFITLLGGATAWPLTARAQRGELMRRVGVLMNFAATDRDNQSAVKAFRQRLNELGWSEGRNLRVDDRWAAGDLERLRVYAAELVSLQPDVILGVSTPTVAALRQATRTIPIVFTHANNPVDFGFVASLARPGGNITGFVSLEPSMGGKWLELLREIAPGIARVALLSNPKTHTGQYFPSIETAGRSHSIELVQVRHQNAAEIESGIENFARAPKGGLLVLPDSSNTVNSDLIIGLAGRYRLPAIYPFPAFTASGGLAYYGSGWAEPFPRAAAYVDRILKGEKPADLPVQAPTRFELVINLKSAKAIGLEIAPMLLARADEVIE